MIQSKFHFDAQFSTYDFFNFAICMHISHITLHVPIYMHKISLWFAETVDLNNWA